MLPTILTEKSYWEQLYCNELQTLEDQGVLGEGWYSQHCGTILGWIDENIETWIPSQKRCQLKTLDIGTGNGLFVFQLAGIGFVFLHGIDYVGSSVQFCRQLRNKLTKALAEGDLERLGRVADALNVDLPPDMELSQTLFCIDDIVDDAFEAKDEEATIVGSILMGTRYDYIHDKGTLDVFILKGCPEVYPTQLLKKYARGGTVITITSSNFTEEELIGLFKHTSHPSLQFEVVQIMNRIPTFTFGGKQGKPIATITFRVVSR
eukprot:Protomagalhaensia_sp_Gyna_25__2309@NODE_2268_length_1182_cov_24_511811_g1880_i0_p1_GENE_NODE_2268_length_1182_cov_24_511811_g1880_i0NODE_2268_length_1182_cov_24_511811_g1880_i0_p1_ORF_typecomplete_len263_score38_34Methyltransf_31/PF13847_6/6_3e08Methyltransf_23/PF13489_6/5_8e06Methyltransf_25/PF13649_6/0_005Methyltransf_11/PF08241_12/0_0085MetW/PF07021_12/0_12MetW/PF07021_12/4e02TIG/PF01833_24/0_053Methyltransf_9/PF08003_11/0_13TehB/PF03848_14/0_39TehB/PF03848_14/3_9e03_NODE_2268_length_1182_cov